MSVLWLLGCAGSPSSGVPGGVGEESRPGDHDTAAGDSGTEDTALGATVAKVDDIAWLARLSLDLRGTRPTVEEMAAVQADPAVIDEDIDAWLSAPEFADRIAWIWNDTFHTAVWADDYDRFAPLRFAEWQALGAEPLQMVRAIVDEDRPIQDLVTTQQTMANPTLATLFGLPYTGKDDEWAWTSYADSRPQAGVLSASSVWLRYTADATNFNRRRANAVAGVLLCVDFFDRDGQFNFAIDESSLTDIENAVRTEPACLSCHSSLDPMAAFFGGFSERSDNAPTMDAYTRYSAFNADWYAAWTPPAYYGHPGTNIEDLGAMIAADPRFASCSARRVYEGLVHAPMPIDAGWATAFVDDDDSRVRAFARRVVHSDAYRATDVRTLTTEQLHTAWADLLAWDPGTDANEGLKPLSWSEEHRVLGGGTDDDTVLTRNPAPGVGMQVMLEWAARAAAGPALAADRARDPADRVLLTQESDVDAQLAEWYARFLSFPVAADGPEVAGLRGLFDAAGGGDAGWTEALTALMRHPRAVMY